MVMAILYFICQMIQATQLAAATPVPVNRNTRTLPINILRTYFPAATGIDKNI